MTTSTSHNPSLDPRDNEPVAVQILRAKMGGALFLLGTVLYTLYFLFSFVSLFLPSTLQLGELNQLLLEMSDGEFYIPVSTSPDAFTIIVGCFGHLFTLTTVVGLWCAFAAARSRKSPMGTGGLTAVRAIVITTLVFTCIGAGIAILLMIFALILLIGGTAFGMEAELGALFGSIWLVYFIGLLVIVATIVLTICYYASISGTLAKLKYTARTGRPGAPVSMYLIVMNFIGFVFSFISFIFSLISNLVFITPAGLISLGMDLFSMVSILLFTIVLTSYRSQIGSMRIQEGYSADADSPEAWGAAPVYEEPAPAPAPAPAPVAAPVNVQVSMFSGPMMAAPQQPVQTNGDQQVLVTPQPAPAPAMPPVANNYTDVTAHSVENAQTVQTDPAAFSQVPVAAAEPTAPAPSPAQNVIRFCQECGASLPENAMFCSNCGHRL